MRHLACLALVPIACAGHRVTEANGAPQELESGCDELIVGLALADGEVGVAVGGDQEEGTPALLLSTRDGGGSWKRVDLGIETRLYAADFPSRTRGYVVGLGGGVWRTVDGGEGWETLELGFEGWLAAVAFTTPMTGFVAGEGRIFKTTDGGESWRSVLGGEGDPDDVAFLRDLDFPTAEVGFAVGGSGVLLRTVDAGETWQRLETGVDTWLRCIRFLDGDVGFLGGTRALLTTSDGGATWRSLPHPPEKVNDVLFLDAARGLTVTMEGVLRRTRDGGATWETVYENGSQALTAIEPRGSGTFLIAGDGGSVLAYDW